MEPWHIENSTELKHTCAILFADDYRRLVLPASKSAEFIYGSIEHFEVHLQSVSVFKC
jgi:hypothetical protein